MKKNYFKYIIGCVIVVVCMIAMIGMKNREHIIPNQMTTLDLSLQDNEFYLDDTNYEETMQTVVIPYIEPYRTEGYFTSEDGAKMHYEQYLLEDAKNHIVISHGYRESVYKYREVIYYFMKAGYSVSIVDHRGHSLSERMIEDMEKIHIEDFGIYLSDFKTFMDDVVIPSTPEANFFLYAHSMGGGIGALFMEEYPEYFTAAVLTAPMMEIDTGSYPKWVTNMLANFMNFINKGEAYILGHGPYEPQLEIEEDPAISEERHLYMEQIKLDKKYLQLGGGTFAWLKAGLEATDKLQKNASKATTPILVFQAENDELVRPEGHYIFANGAPNTQLVFVEDSQHEIYLASNEILIPYFNTIFKFFGQYTK